MDNFENSFINELVGGASDIVVCPMPPTKLSSLVVSTGYFKFTETIGHFSLGHIASVTKPGVRSEYLFINGFDLEVWMALLITLLSLSLFTALINRNVRKFFSSIWQFSTVLLSDYMTKFGDLISEKIVVVFWLLLAGVVLFNAFSGCIWSFMIQKLEIQKIDSWNDLHENWKDMKIIAMDNGNYAEFLRNENSEMAQDFNKRTELIPTQQFLRFDIRESYFIRILMEKYVLIFEYQALKAYRNEFRFYQTFKMNKGSKYGVDLHISETGGGTTPYFLLVKNNPKIDFIGNLNKVIIQLKESGIYDHWMEVSSRVYGTDGDSNAQTVDNTNEPLTLNHLSGVFKILIYGLTLSTTVFILEWIYYLFTKYLLKE